METSPSYTPVNQESQPAGYESGAASADRRAMQTIKEERVKHAIEMDRLHGEALADNYRWKQEADQAEHEQTIEDRINSGDVQALNDVAELEIFGSRGREYIHPAAGKIDKDHPYKGILEQMREEPAKMQGRPQAERDKAARERNEKAEKYEQELQYLIDREGLELCQAKMVMDLTEKDKVAKDRFIKRLEADGVTLRDSQGNVVTPEEKATERYEHLDEERIKLIRREGAFTPEEYIRVMNGESLYGHPSGEDEGHPAGEAIEQEGDEPDDIGAEHDEFESPEPAEDEETNEIDGVIRNINALLRGMPKVGNSGSKHAHMLKPVKKRDFSTSNRDLLRYPKLLNVRAPGSSKHTNLSKKLKGHVKVEEDTVWIIPSAFAPMDDFAKKRVITPDGRIYENFTEDEETGDIVVDLGSHRKIEDLPDEHVRLIEKYLRIYHDDRENNDSIKPSQESDAVSERNRLIEETGDQIEALRQLDKNSDEYNEAERRVKQTAHELKLAQDMISGKSKSKEKKSETTSESKNLVDGLFANGEELSVSSELSAEDREKMNVWLKNELVCLHTWLPAENARNIDRQHNPNGHTNQFLTLNTRSDLAYKMARQREFNTPQFAQSDLFKHYNITDIVTLRKLSETYGRIHKNSSRKNESIVEISYEVPPNGGNSGRNGSYMKLDLYLPESESQTALNMFESNPLVLREMANMFMTYVGGPDNWANRPQYERIKDNNGGLDRMAISGDFIKDYKDAPKLVGKVIEWENDDLSDARISTLDKKAV